MAWGSDTPGSLSYNGGTIVFFMRHTSGKAKGTTRWQYMNIKREKGAHSSF